MLIAIASEITASTKNTTQTDKSQSRYHSYLLADEFRQTSMDLTQRLDERGNNELSMLGLGLNLFTENIRSMIAKLHNNIEKNPACPPS